MLFFPIPERVFSHYGELTPEMLREEKIKLLLCDLDYTLAPKSVKRPDEAVRQWVNALRKEGITVMILSNNRSSRRVEQFCGGLGIDYVGHAKKPSIGGVRRAMEKAGVDAGETAMLGDKLLTDVLAARRSGVHAFMVEPAGGARTVWQKVLHAMQSPFKAAAGKKNNI